jgi:protein-tyrosine phosphatase
MYTFKTTENIYEWISCLIKDKLYFGPFPNQHMIDSLLKENFDVIVNLTMDDENIFADDFNDSNDSDNDNSDKKEEQTQTYKVPKNKYISYQIKDNDIPKCPLSYCSFITKLKELYIRDKKIYIHCRGGHGRSGMVSVSILLSIFQEKNIKDTIEFVNQSHINRIILREKWKTKKTPFNYTQHLFLLKIHKNVYISNINKYYNWLIFNDTIYIENQKYDTLYEFYNNSLLDHDIKTEHIKNYFKSKIKSNKDIEYKFYLTYLKNLIITDCDNKNFCKDYSNILYQIREDFLINN